MNSVAASDHGNVPAPGTARLVANFLSFQAGWFACVLGAANDLPWTGSAIAAALVAAHIAVCRRPLTEVRLIGFALLIGLVWESLLLNLGWLDFHSGIVIAGVAPLWIVIMWALFAMTLNVSLAWLKERPFTAIVFGAAGGPLAYWAGARLGALELSQPLPALLALAVGWGALTPLLLRLARRYDGMRTGN
jgi:hypothetical protein